MTDYCVFRSCNLLISPTSRVVCTTHQAAVDREEEALRRRTGHVCPTHPEQPAELFDEVTDE